MTDPAIVAAVRRDLAERADPVRAQAMQAYMKSAMPFYGVPAPEVRRICRAIYTANRLDSREEWEHTVRAMFDRATHREERYAALALAAHRYYRGFQVPESLPLYRHLVVEGAWWDFVDDVSHRVGDVLRAHRSEAEPVVRAWSRDEVMWLRRTAIICQLGHRDDTDRDLLRDAINANVDDSAFFIRKAIGWALREYARTDPEWVAAFVAERRDRLAPLSVREALKHIGG